LAALLIDLINIIIVSLNLEMKLPVACLTLRITENNQL